MTNATTITASWPQESREAAKLVIDAYGEPTESTDTLLIWDRPGPWKRIVASKAFYQHEFPAPHIDAVESVLDYHVPPEMVSDLARFDGSVVVERTAGEVSARCHDEQANYLALNLMDDIVNGRRDVDDARAYYTKEFLDYRRKQPTPYMDGLRFETSRSTPDADSATASPADLQRASQEGEGR